ncbi:MAG: LLM class flavin-dependent oxidoreductase [Chloroflexi bacterium]|nr:LLM class flavin-dependent oxidoreductase [Chloroflexota bacterium]
MKVYYFSEFPYHEYPDEEGEKYPSLRLTFPNTYFEPETASDLFKRYFDECVYVDEMGFDGIMVNEHHNTPSCMNASCNLSAAVLARTTKNAKILLLGNILPIHDNPVRLAEEIAMIDVISGGRVISGMVRGTGVETLSTNGNPMYNRERFEECHDLVIKTWTEPGPFRWEGKHYNFRVVNPWMVPVQKPHPPVWVPGTASPETAQWAAEHGYTYVAFLTPLDVTEDLFQIYRTTAAEKGYEPTPDNFGYLLCCYVADTQEEADEQARHFIWRMGTTTRGPREYMNPVGYRSQQGEQVAARRAIRPLIQQSYEELNENYHIVAGTPDTVLEKIRYLYDRLGMDHLIFYGQESKMSHDATMKNIGLFGKEVLPEIQKW